MKAAQLAEYHKDFKIGTVADPVITGPMDVIVRVGAAGVCRTDLHMQEGQLDAAHKGAGVCLPFTCGHETAGWVAEVGVGVTHVKVGDAVLLHPVAGCGFCRACRAGNDMHCQASMFPGVFAPGGFAEYVKTGARAVLPLPEGVAPIDVASFACAGLTVYHAVKKAVPHANPGSTVVVLGAGGLGHLAIQLMRALSQAEVVAVDQSPVALENARSWGADAVVLARPDRGHIAEIRDMTEGRGAQVVLDCIGEHGVQNDAVELLGANGIDMLIGYGGELKVDILSQALFPETSFVGNICGTYNELAELVALQKRGAVKIASTPFGLDNVNDALNTLRAGKMVGRGVIVPA